MRLAQQFTFHHVERDDQPVHTTGGKQGLRAIRSAFEAGIGRIADESRRHLGHSQHKSGLDEALDRLRCAITRWGSSSSRSTSFAAKRATNTQDSPSPHRSLVCPSMTPGIVSVKAFSTTAFEVELTNLGPQAWCSNGGRYPINLSYHWHGQDGRAGRVGRGSDAASPGCATPVTYFALVSSCMPPSAQACTDGAPHSCRKERNGSSLTTAASGNPSSLCVSRHELGLDGCGSVGPRLRDGRRRRAAGINRYLRLAEVDRANAEADLPLVQGPEEVGRPPGFAFDHQPGRIGIVGHLHPSSAPAPATPLIRLLPCRTENGSSRGDN